MHAVLSKRMCHLSVNHFQWGGIRLTKQNLEKFHILSRYHWHYLAWMLLQVDDLQRHNLTFVNPSPLPPLSRPTRIFNKAQEILKSTSQTSTGPLSALDSTQSSQPKIVPIFKPRIKTASLPTPNLKAPAMIPMFKALKPKQPQVRLGKEFPKLPVSPQMASACYSKISSSACDTSRSSALEQGVFGRSAHLPTRPSSDTLPGKSAIKRPAEVSVLRNSWIAVELHWYLYFI